MKRDKDALSAGCVSLPRNRQISADFMIDRNVTSQAYTAPGTLKNGNDVAVASHDGFTTVKGANAKKKISSTSSKSFKKNKQPMIVLRNLNSPHSCKKGSK
jgi:hypothetical protein